MSITFALAIYFIIWWTVLFCVLPFGVRSQEEAGEVAPGSEAAAPVRPMMLTKVIVTTLVASVVFAAVYVVIVFRLIDLDSIPQGL